MRRVGIGLRAELFRRFLLSGLSWEITVPAVVLALVVLVWPSHANENPETYISKLPRSGAFRIVVLGDSLADGLHHGLTQLNKDREDIDTDRKSKVNTGLVRSDRFDWNRGAKKIARRGRYHAAIVQLGLNDLQTIREKGKAHHYKTDGWIKRYTSRVEQMMADLKSKGMAVYWVGIPIVAKSHYQSEFLYLNTVFKAAAEKTGVRFVDTWEPLASPRGKYRASHKLKNGKTVEIRRRDGVHFTPQGYQIFAGFVNDIVLDDLTKAGFISASSSSE